VNGEGALIGLFTREMTGRDSSLMPASWNQIAIWLKQIDGLRQAA
jgi:hypothetical protein